MGQGEESVECCSSSLSPDSIFHKRQTKTADRHLHQTTSTSTSFPLRSVQRTCAYTSPVPAGRSQSRESLEGGRPGSGRYGVISRYDDSYFPPLRYNSGSHERRVHERNKRGNPQCDCWRPMFFEDLLLQLLALAAKHAWRP